MKELIDEILVFIAILIIIVWGLKKNGRIGEKNNNIILGLASYIIIPFRYPNITQFSRIIISIFSIFVAWFVGKFINWYREKKL